MERLLATGLRIAHEESAAGGSRPETYDIYVEQLIGSGPIALWEFGGIRGGEKLGMNRATQDWYS